MAPEPEGTSDVKGAHILALFGDSITTDHISPAGSIAKGSPAAEYLTQNGVERADFNSYGARRGNHEVMMRGTFANIRIKNEICGGKEGGWTKFQGLGDDLSIYDAAMKYMEKSIPTVIFAGKEYGTGSSRDWAAKGPNLQGVKVVIAESFERIHRSNLVGMGIVPLQFKNGVTWKSLGLNGTETVETIGCDHITPKKDIKCKIYRDGKLYKECDLLCRVDTEVEVEYINNGGILHYVLRRLTAN
jgi:aconitate hydratase